MYSYGSSGCERAKHNMPVEKCLSTLFQFSVAGNLLPFLGTYPQPRGQPKATRYADIELQTRQTALGI